jgi:tripeptidyl-peptidase-2
MSNDLLARTEVLQDLIKDYEDPGEIFDCVVFHDGSCWRAVIDADASGDLTKAPVMTNFVDEREFHRFSDADFMNYSVNIFDDGNLLSIVSGMPKRN